VPQLWALYKEVQEYYEKGMRVPVDVTLLWCDDNWGNIRRLPTAEERRRPGGAGVYYHFDYVGGPRSYKWLNTVPIAKAWEQMHLAWRHGADRIRIVNVGDLKPMEFPIEFFLTYARDPERWPHTRLTEYGRLWAAREFGDEHAAEIAALVQGYTRLNGRRKQRLAGRAGASDPGGGRAGRRHRGLGGRLAQSRSIAARCRAPGPEPLRPAAPTIEVFNRGREPLSFAVRASEPWLAFDNQAPSLVPLETGARENWECDLYDRSPVGQPEAKQGRARRRG
jgi:hypothetical protein